MKISRLVLISAVAPLMAWAQEAPKALEGAPMASDALPPPPADEAAPAAAPEVALPAVERMVTPYAGFESRLALTDTENKKSPYWVATGGLAIAQFGLRIKHGVVAGQFEARIGTMGAQNGQDYFIRLRQGWAGLALPSGTTIKLGRSRPLSVWSYTPTFNRNIDNMGSADGVFLVQDVSLGGKDKITGEVYYANAIEKGLPILQPGRSGYPATTPMANFSSDSATNSRGYGVGGVVAIQGVMARVAYGAQSNSTLKVLADKRHVLGDVGHLETSLGYDTGTGLSFGGFYEQWTSSKQKVATLLPNGKFTGKTDVTDKDALNESSKAQSTARWSLGVTAESKLIGITNMLQRGDAIVTSVGYEQSPINRISGSKTYNSDFDVNSISGSVGYKVDGLLISGGVEYAFTKKAATQDDPNKVVVFQDNEGKPKKSAVKTLVHVIYYF